MMRGRVSVRQLCAATICATMAFAVPASAAEPCTLRLGWSVFEPFQMPGTGDEPTGLDMEIFQTVMQRAGCKVREYRKAPWSRMLAEVEKGRVDAILSASYTQARSNFGHYSKPYRTVSYAAVYHDAGAKRGSQSMADIIAGNPMIGRFRGGYLPPFIKQAIAPAEAAGRVYQGASYEKMIELLEKGRLDLMLAEINDPHATFKQVDGNPAFRVVEIEGSTDKLHLLYSRKTVTPAIVSRLDAEISGFVGSPEYRALFEKYLKR